jgi:hypothetical protein
MYRNTWYERVYGAVPDSATLCIKEAILKKLDEPITMDFEEFQERIIPRVVLPDEQENELKALFKSSESWLALFKAIYKRFGCGMFESIPRQFYRKYKLQDIAGSIWHIPRYVIEAYNIDLTYEQDQSMRGGSIFNNLPYPWA